jgi:hypothetical protein
MLIWCQEKSMSKTVHGVYRNGRVELPEDTPTDLVEGPVLITFLDSGDIDLWSRGIEKEQANDLRDQLAQFEAEWESPEMSLYDDYAKSKLDLQKR